jgi:hypothetical protein
MFFVRDICCSSCRPRAAISTVSDRWTVHDFLKTGRLARPSPGVSALSRGTTGESLFLLTNAGSTNRHTAPPTRRRTT